MTTTPAELCALLRAVSVKDGMCAEAADLIEAQAKRIEELEAVEAMRDEEIARLREKHGDALGRIDELERSNAHRSDALAAQSRKIEQQALENIALEAQLKAQEGAEPVGEWIEHPLSHCPSLKWRHGYVARSGAKLYAYPPAGAAILSSAAISACALMILGICKTRPQDEWPSNIEGRIRYMLTSHGIAAEKEKS
jgi:hypothetical protein